MASAVRPLDPLAADGRWWRAAGRLYMAVGYFFLVLPIVTMIVFSFQKGQFASLFRDKLGCDNALFLDGSISALYAPELDRDDFTLPMGPIVGVVAKVK